jgi:hypothetical protein
VPFLPLIMSSNVSIKYPKEIFSRFFSITKNKCILSF